MKKTRVSLPAAMVLAALIPFPAFGHYLWTNAAGDNDFANMANWSDSGNTWIVALDGDNRAIIGPGHELTLTRNFAIGRNEGGDGELEINGSIVSFERVFRIGAAPDRTGTVTMTDGILNAGRSINIGQDPGSVGTFNLSGGIFNANLDTSREFGQDNMTVAASDATGVLNISGSGMINLSRGDAEIGEGANATATVSISDAGQLDIGGNARFGFGDDSTTTLNISGGFINAASGFVTMGQGVNAEVSVTMSGGEINADRMIWANDGTATLTMTGGVITVVGTGGGQTTSGAFAMGPGMSSLDVSGDSVINPEKLYIAAGGVLTLSGDAVINIAGSTDGVNPTFDFSLDELAGGQVLGKIAVNGGSIQVAGAADPVSAFDYVELLTAAIEAGTIFTEVDEANLALEYDAEGDLTRLTLASDVVSPVVSLWEGLEEVQGWKAAGIGWIIDDDYPFILHAVGGWLWIFVDGASLDGFYGYDFITGNWFWSRDDFAGWYYSYGSGDWQRW